MAPKKKAAEPKGPTVAEVEADWHHQQVQWKKELKKMKVDQERINEDQRAAEKRNRDLHASVEKLERDRDEFTESSENKERSLFIQLRHMEEVIDRDEAAAEGQKEKHIGLIKLLETRRKEASRAKAARELAEAHPNIAAANEKRVIVQAMAEKLKQLRMQEANVEGTVASFCRRDDEKAREHVRCKKTHLIVASTLQSVALCNVLVRQAVQQRGVHTTFIHPSIVVNGHQPASNVSEDGGVLTKVEEASELLCEHAVDRSTDVLRCLSDALWSASRTINGEENLIVHISGVAVTANSSSAGTGGFKQVAIATRCRDSLSFGGATHAKVADVTNSAVCFVAVDELIEVVLRQSRSQQATLIIDASAAAAPGFCYIGGTHTKPFYCEFDDKAAAQCHGVLTAAVADILSEVPQAMSQASLMEAAVRKMEGLKIKVPSDGADDDSGTIRWVSETGGSLPPQLRTAYIEDDEDEEGAPQQLPPVIPKVLFPSMVDSLVADMELAVPAQLLLSERLRGAVAGDSELSPSLSKNAARDVVRKLLGDHSTHLAVQQVDSLDGIAVEARSTTNIIFRSAFTAGALTTAVHSAIEHAQRSRNFTLLPSPQELQLSLEAASPNAQCGVLRVTSPIPFRDMTCSRFSILDTILESIKELPEGAAHVAEIYRVRATQPTCTTTTLLQQLAAHDAALLRNEDDTSMNLWMCTSATLLHASLAPAHKLQPPPKHHSTEEILHRLSDTSQLLFVYVVDHSVDLDRQHEEVQKAASTLLLGQQNSETTLTQPRGLRNKLQRQLNSADKQTHHRVSSQRIWRSTHVTVDWERDLQEIVALNAERSEEADAVLGVAEDHARLTRRRLVETLPPNVMAFLAEVRYPALIVCLANKTSEVSSPALVLPRGKDTSGSTKDGRFFFIADAIAEGGWSLLNERVYGLPNGGKGSSGVFHDMSSTAISTVPSLATAFPV